ncbi:helicase [Malassezia nana]|uniref:Helicase n=1 Tax=Malassezia nana TaxID=180528 RepID=A0AAF0EL57_9BASI|nr:helicase [Malassezia nana]
MKRPSPKHQKIFGRGLPVVDVVLDPELSRILRPHQIEGVKFMYEAVTGMASVDYGHASTGQGAILADEMGLGKTLQTITLIMTLLRQSCYFSSVSSGTVEKVLIVCPLTLVVNWKREFRKWVGRSSVGLLAVEGDGRSEVERFVSGRQYQVLILGYERLRNCVNELAKAFPSIGLIVCDEGHRLKSKDTKTTKCFDLLPTRRRLLLTGTPIQNDLREFYTMVDFVYPGLFDQYSVFKRVFEDPIMRSRLQHCSEEALKLGRARNKALATVTKGVIIRRTADLLESYLPSKYEMMLFCTMSPIQLRIYGLCSEFVSNQLALGKGRNFLPYITLLRQLCNSPDLLRQDLSYIPRETESEVQALTRAVETLLDQKSLCSSASLGNSGKMMVLHRLLTSIHRHTKDRVIIVSNYTSTLDMLQRYCVQQNFTTLRLDGRTKAGARSKLVQQFNKQADRSEAEPFVFLLSSKSGGVGLNLIGGNRLILFDSDWNPASDRQAMARIHRDGQKKSCYIYPAQVSSAMDYDKTQRRKLARQLTGLLHFDFGTHAASFPFDDMLQQAQLMEGEESPSTPVAPPDLLCADPTTCTKPPSDTVNDDTLFLERLLTKYLRPSTIPISYGRGGKLSYVFIKPPEVAPPSHTLAEPLRPEP